MIKLELNDRADCEIVAEALIRSGYTVRMESTEDDRHLVHFEGKGVVLPSENKKPTKGNVGNQGATNS